MTESQTVFVQELAPPASAERAFIQIARSAGEFPKALTPGRQGGDANVRVWCNNDYLGMGQHRAVLEEMKRAIDRFGAGSGGSRGLAGNNPYHVLLERELASLHQKQSAVLFNSGYIANDGALTTIAGELEGVIVFSDEQNHASLIEGIRHSRAEKRVFRHNDAAHLQELLAAVDPTRPKLIVIESVYSMTGEVAPLAEIAQLARRYDALSYVDEVHAVGMYGPEGAGMVAREGLADEFTFVMGTLGKGFGTSGGYVTGPAEAMRVIRGSCRNFLFTTSLAPAIAAGALASVRHLRASNAERDRLHVNARLLHRLLAERGIAVTSRATHIVPVVVGDETLCERACALLLDRHQIYLEPIKAPLVRRGLEMLRITPSAAHTIGEVRAFANALNDVWTELRLPRVPVPNSHEGVAHGLR